jgi:anti-anti-sigma factor
MCDQATTTTEILALVGRREDSSWVIVVRGELDMSCCTKLHEGFAVPDDVSCDRIVIDMSGVTFLDCGGLHALETAAASFGTELWLRSPSRPVQRLAELVGFGPSGWRGETSDDDVRLA